MLERGHAKHDRQQADGAGFECLPKLPDTEAYEMKERVDLFSLQARTENHLASYRAHHAGQRGPAAHGTTVNSKRTKCFCQVLGMIAFTITC
jgi:hypothetical protein